MTLLNKRFITAVSFMCLITPNEVMAESITFAQLVEKSFEQNLGIKIKQQQKIVELETESATFRKLFPSFRITSSRNEVLHNSNDAEREISFYSTNFELSQPLYQPALLANWRKSSLNKLHANWDHKGQIQSLFFQLKEAWFTFLTNQILYAESQEALIRLEQHKKNAEAFYKSGKIWRNDLLQASVRVSRGEQDVFAAANRLALSKATINLLLNQPIDDEINPVGSLQKVEFAKTLSQLQTKAINNRFELKQNKIAIELAQEDAVIVRSKYKPSVDLTLSSGIRASDADYSDSITENSIAINLSWNYGQWGQTAREIDAADARLTVKQLELAQQKSLIEFEVKSAFLSVKESEYSLKVSVEALKQAEENYRVSQIRYQEQLGSASDVLDAQDLLTQTVTNRIVSLNAYLTSIAKLSLVVGDSIKL